MDANERKILEDAGVLYPTKTYIKESLDKRFNALSHESTIHHLLGYIEGIGYALPASVQPAFFNATEALCDEIRAVFELY